MKTHSNNSSVILLTQTFILLTFFACINSGQEKRTNHDDTTSLASPQIKYLSEQIKKNPNDAQLYSTRSNEFLGLNDTLSAIADLYIALQLDSIKSNYSERLAELLIQKGDAKSAMKIIDRAIEINPETVKTHIKKATFHFYLKEYKNAILQLNEALKIDLYNSDAYFWKGMCYLEMDDTAKSISSFQTAVELNSMNYDAYMELGILYSAKKDKQALNYFDNAIRINQTSEAFYAKGMFYQDNYDYPNAIETYKKIILIDPQYEEAFYNIGWIYFHTDSLEKAYRNFDRAIGVAPTYVEAYYMRGLCSENMGDKNKAKRDYNQALNLSPKMDLAQKGLKRVEK